MTRSDDLRSSSLVVPAMRPTAASRSRAPILPRFTSSSSVSCNRASPRLTSSASASTKRTWNPACAVTCTMTEPMRPHPTTPTLVIGMRCERLLPDDAARQWRRLVVDGARRARVSHGDRRGAVPYASVGLHLALGRARSWTWLRLLHGPLERGVARLGGRRREHVVEQGGVDRRFGLVGPGRGGPPADQNERERDGGDSNH